MSTQIRIGADDYKVFQDTPRVSKAVNDVNVRRVAISIGQLFKAYQRHLGETFLTRKEKRLLSTLLGSTSAKIDAIYDKQKPCDPCLRKGAKEQRMEGLVASYNVSNYKTKAIKSFILSNPFCMPVADDYPLLGTSKGEPFSTKRILISSDMLGQFFPIESDLKRLDERVKTKQVCLLLISHTAWKEINGGSKSCVII